MTAIYLTFLDYLRFGRCMGELSVELVQYLAKANTTWSTNKQALWYFLYGTGAVPFGGEALILPRKYWPKEEKPRNIPNMPIMDFSQPGLPVLEVIPVRVANLPGGGEGSFPPHMETHMLLFDYMVEAGVVDPPHIPENPQVPGWGAAIVGTALAGLTVFGAVSKFFS